MEYENTVKLELIERLASRGEYFKAVNKVEYRTRCPYCGDSEKNMNTGHFYIRINPSDNFPVVYHCFKCEAKGIFKEEELMAFEIDDITFKSNFITMNKKTDKIDSKNFATETEFLTFDYVIPEQMYDDKIKYVEDRLGITITKEMMKEMKIITSLRDFLKENNIKEISCSNSDAWRLEDHFVGFLSYGASHILFRDISGEDTWRWVKYPITEESKKNKIFYIMSSEIDPYTTEPITINLAEGVMDTLGICYNLGYNSKNTLNISVSGKYYDKILLFLLDLGFVGSNITVNVFSDNDIKFNKKGGNTTLDFYKKKLKNFKHIYGKVNVIYNKIGKDYGVKKSEICIEKHTI